VKFVARDNTYQSHDLSKLFSTSTTSQIILGLRVKLNQLQFFSTLGIFFTSTTSQVILGLLDKPDQSQSLSKFFPTSTTSQVILGLLYKPDQFQFLYTLGVFFYVYDVPGYIRITRQIIPIPIFI
jgi:hypothetical protein